MEKERGREPLSLSCSMKVAQGNTHAGGWLADRLGLGRSLVILLPPPLWACPVRASSAAVQLVKPACGVLYIGVLRVKDLKPEPPRHACGGGLCICVLLLEAKPLAGDATLLAPRAASGSGNPVQCRSVAPFEARWPARRGRGKSVLDDGSPRGACGTCVRDRVWISYTSWQFWEMAYMRALGPVPQACTR